MKRSLLAIGFLFLASCGGKDAPIAQIGRSPVSVRGWIADVKGSTKSDVPEIAIALRTQMFGATSVWIEDSPYASGGVAENGSFIILDVPPGKITVGFNAPGAEDAKVVMDNIPGSVDVFIPGLILEHGGATVIDPKAIKVRVASTESVEKPTGQYVTIAGHRVPVMATPLGQMVDRRDYPNPGGLRPLARVR
ncbi:MAG TPA: hypothetical protein VMU84_10060 [Thermoanaerobaculia bacterium]|nr:hypothetical protein [Thermoanaerobaculia bacterium]